MAKNIIGTYIVADGEEIPKNEETEQAYKELGTSILEYQDVIAGHGQDNGKTADELNNEIKVKIENLVNLAFNNKKENEKKDLLTMASDLIYNTQPARVEAIQGKFEAAKENKDSSLSISTKNRAAVVEEYKAHIENPKLVRTPKKGWEKVDNECDQDPKVEIKDGKPSIKMTLRSETDGRIMAQKLSLIHI